MIGPGRAPVKAQFGVPASRHKSIGIKGLRPACVRGSDSDQSVSCARASASIGAAS
jgi:hypothetical protein